MIGKILGGTYKILAKILVRIPIIGRPLYNAIDFFMLNLIKALTRLPYVLGGIFLGLCALTLFGII